MNKKKEYPMGIYFNLPRENSPAWVIGRIAINKAKLAEWLKTKATNEKGYIYLDVLESERDGETTAYLAVNNWKPSQPATTIPEEVDKLNF